jgi:hypothetical protein
MQTCNSVVAPAKEKKSEASEGVISGRNRKRKESFQWKKLSRTPCNPVIMQKSSHSRKRRGVSSSSGKRQGTKIRPWHSGNTPFTGGWSDGDGRSYVCRSLVHYVGRWRCHWDLFEYLLVSRKREHGGFLHTVRPGYILGLVDLLELNN